MAWTQHSRSHLRTNRVIKDKAGMPLDVEMKKQASVHLVLVISLVGQILGKAAIGGERERDIAASVMGFVSAALSNGIALIAGAASKASASKFLDQRTNLVAQKEVLKDQRKRLQDEKAELKSQLAAAESQLTAAKEKNVGMLDGTQRNLVTAQSKAKEEEAASQSRVKEAPAQSKAKETTAAPAKVKEASTAQQQLPPPGGIEHSPHPSVLEMPRDHQVGPVSDGDWFDGEWVRDDVGYAISAKNGQCVAPGSKGTMAAPFYPGTYHIDSATQARIRPTVCLSRSRPRCAWCV